MSPEPSIFNPSQTVERIREILVGRHLERLEQRVARLETTPANVSDANATSLPAAPFPQEASLEPLKKEDVERMVEMTREETEQRWAQYRAETQKLAQQIQQVAAMKASESAPVAVERLEQKLGSWLTDWQTSFHVHLHDRDRRLANQLRMEVAALWENTESQLTRLESRTVDRDSIEERFARIAEAARALAECASPSNSSPGASAT